MKPAVNLMDWLIQIAGCQNDPDAINFDGAEDAVIELRDRADECFEYCQSAEQTPEIAMLIEMGETMDRIADLLDSFLETELFYHLQEAIDCCANLMVLREQITASEGTSTL